MSTSAQESLAAAESEAVLFEKLRLQGVTVKPKNAWKQSIGWAKHSAEHQEAMRLGAEWRAAVNQNSMAELNGHS